MTSCRNPLCMYGPPAAREQKRSCGGIAGHDYRETAKGLLMCLSTSYYSQLTDY
jgi:hypothetical protein